MRPVFYIFTITEVVLTLVIIHYNMMGFYSQPIDRLPIHTQARMLFYTISTYVFCILASFDAINMCTGQKTLLIMSILRTFFGAVMLLIISLMTLEDAEGEYHLFHMIAETNPIGPEKPVHPFFLYQRGQAFWALACSMLHMLHSLTGLDVLLSNPYAKNDDDEVVYEYKDFEPVRLYLLGESTHEYLWRYRWFRSLCQDETIAI
ncbi:uncharacterized protein LOC108602430 [Drosophila busckii]|uniref:uncharacterized protein LOC108602430 n=1 Tax=Drosophila busckii TaxID=30019 RepID=UPI00083EA7C7|nr:uncharacterized protein LOC108602430 [Drosophila busckii]